MFFSPASSARAGVRQWTASRPAARSFRNFQTGGSSSSTASVIQCRPCAAHPARVDTATGDRRSVPCSVPHAKFFSSTSTTGPGEQNKGRGSLSLPEDFVRKDSKVRTRAHIDRKEFIRKHSSQLDSEYSFSSELGAGGFANVFLVTHKLTGQLRAAKRIHKSKLKGNWEMLENEVKAMQDLDHPHICKLYEHFEEEEYVYLILEYLQGVDLFEHMLNVFSDETHEPQGRFNEYEAAVLMRHMLKAVFCCHSSNIVHRDIKPENFMFANKVDATPDLRMIDLGLSKRDQQAGDGNITGVEGTLAYMAPEMLRGEPYNRKCDVWPLGAICYIMLCGEPLFTLTDDNAAVQEIQNGNFVKRKLQEKRRILSPDAMSFLKATLAFDPSRRLSAKHALCHPFVMKTYMEDGLVSERDPEKLKKILSMGEVLERMRRFSELSTLKRSSLIVLAHMIGTSADEMEAYRLTFRQLDTDGSGSLSLEEFKEGIQRESLRLDQKPIEFPANFNDEIWPAVDLNESDDINFTEFLAACLSSDQYNESHWRAVFQVLDVNKNGHLSAEDFRELFHDNEEKEVLDIWHEICDKDDGTLSAEQYIHFMQNEVPA
ncbi:unnamed protein product [Amoebophrya sp. A120]|nr:unnamed protein product [Amoebophrya sp. A120]|eukprot:GSA120T00011817001.1